MASKIKTIILGVIIIGVSIFGILYVPNLMDTWGEIPKFVDNDWIELDKIYEIGKFHSTLGHGYPREDMPYSDKHYYTPLFNYMNSNHSVKVFSPVDGEVINIFDETNVLNDGTHRGKQVHIKSKEHSSIVFKLFHINIEGFNISIGTRVNAGQQIGYADVREGSGTDIAVTRAGKEISWFEVITDSLFENYKARGIANRTMMIKTDEQAQRSLDMGFNTSFSDPADMVTLKNTKYPQIIAYHIIDPSKVEKVSYFPNNLKYTCDNVNKYNVSNAIFFHLNKSDPSVNISGYNTEIRAPFNAKLSYQCCEGSTFYISLTFHNSSCSSDTMDDFTLNIDLFDVQLEPGVNPGENVSEGQIIGRAKEFFGVKVDTDYNTHQFLPVFGIMDNTILNSWVGRGLESGTAVVLNFDEYLQKMSAIGNSSYFFTEDTIWWYALN